MEIYPAGLILQSSLGIHNPGPEEPSRGRIETFSHEAARRLREEFLTTYVPGCELWKITLTTHGLLSPSEWRALMKRFRVRLVRRGWAGIWRVELQKRKAPHAHVAFWLPPGVTVEDIRTLWLDCTGEANDPAAVLHSVMGSRIPHDEAGWVVYMALHDGKSKHAQLGWEGKQWGVWCRDLFAGRDPERFDLNPREHAVLLRFLQRWDISQRRAINRARDEKLLSAISPEARGSISIVAEKVKPRRFHRGNLLRCVHGETVIAIINAIKKGTIYPCNQYAVADAEKPASLTSSIT